jgi:hypothetical protein
LAFAVASFSNFFRSFSLLRINCSIRLAIAWTPPYSSSTGRPAALVVSDSALSELLAMSGRIRLYSKASVTIQAGGLGFGEVDICDEERWISSEEGSRSYITVTGTLLDMM